MRDSAFADRLALAIQGKCVSQTEFAAAVGVSQSTVSRWLSGAMPRRLVLVGIAQFLNVSVDWLRTGKGDSFYFSAFTTSPLPRDFFSRKWSERTEAERDEIITQQIAERQRGLGVRVHLLRTKLGLSLREFARRCGYTAGYISKLENGSRSNVSLEFQEKLIQVFGLTRAWVAQGDYPIFHRQQFPHLDYKEMSALENFQREEEEKFLDHQRKDFRKLVNELNISNERLVGMIEKFKLANVTQNTVDSRVIVLTEILTERLTEPKGDGGKK